MNSGEVRQSMRSIGKKQGYVPGYVINRESKLENCHQPGKQKGKLGEGRRFEFLGERSVSATGMSTGKMRKMQVRTWKMDELPGFPGFFF